MTRNIKGRTVIYAESQQQCDVCGKIAELRPYGPKGEMICHACGVANRETTERRMDYVFAGGDERWGSFDRWAELVRTIPKAVPPLAMRRDANGGET